MSGEGIFNVLALAAEQPTDEYFGADGRALAAHLSDQAKNIKMLGAKGDGVTDDSGIIQAALQKYDYVYFPAGTYYCANGINLNWDYINTNKILTGNNATILFKNQTNIVATNHACMAFTVASLIIDGLNIQYLCDTVPAFNLQLGGNGANSGILLAVYSGNVYVKNSNLSIIDSRAVVDYPVSCTCFWAKAQYGALPKIIIRDSVLRNETKSTIGGCLWISNVDIAGADTSLVDISRNQFYRAGNDEAIAVWTSQNNKMDIVNIHDNEFVYTGNVYNDNLLTFRRLDQPMASNVNLYNNKIFNTQATDFAKSSLMYFRNITGNVAGNVININTTYANAKIIGIQVGAVVNFHDNDITVTSTTNFTLHSYTGGSFYAKNNRYNLTVDSLSLIDDANTLVTIADLLFKYNKLICTITNAATNVVGIKFSDTGLYDISYNDMSFTATSTQMITPGFTSPGVAVSHEVKFIGNRLTKCGLQIPGKANSLKILLIRDNVSDSLFVLYPGAIGYAKLIATNNISSNFQNNWGVATLANLATIATIFLWKNNYKYADLTEMIPA